MDPFIGQIQAFAFPFAPRGWALCQGQLLPIAQNPALFALIGTTYGGDGRTNFALPDLRGRTNISQGQLLNGAPYVMGQLGGTPEVSLSLTQIPAHGHEVKVSSDSAAIFPQDRYFGTLTASAGDAPKGYGTTAGKATISPTAISATGSGTPHDNMPPFLVVNWCIATWGIFPSRW